MKIGIKHICTASIVFVIFTLLLSCGASKKVSIDYGNAEAFEKALNAGENLEGKVVQFTAVDFRPDSMLGYNVWAGEHLNFISSRNPDIKAGDTVTVKALTIESSLGSWIITYEKVGEAEVTENTIFAEARSDGSVVTEENNSEEVSESSNEKPNNSGGLASFSVEDNSSNAEKLPLEIVDYGWYMNEIQPYDDTAYVEFCAMIYNPNETYIAEFPKAIVTVKNGDGSILATKEQTGSIVMPQDTITLCGMFSMPVSDVSDDAQITFDVDWSEMTTGNVFYSEIRTTDLVFSNVSERNGSNENFITGEVTNNSSIDVESVNLSIVLRKEGKIVYMENTFLDGLKAGKTKAFEFQRYHSWPEHDTIECSGMPW